MTLKDQTPQNQGLEETQSEPHAEPSKTNVVVPNPLNIKDQKIKNEIRQHAETVPSRYRTNYLKSVSDNPSKAGSIRAKCLDCVGYEDAPNRIRDCKVSLCPLWEIRPYQKK